MIDTQNIIKKSALFESYMKSPRKSIKHSTYFPVYDAIFNKYKNKKITFVEIGVLGGGSLFMWRNYFGEKARIIGIDINEQARELEQYGFEIYIASQSNFSEIQDVFSNIGPIDVLLDDGGHTNVAQITTVEAALDFINDDGMIVVEDTHTAYMLGYGAKRYSFMRYVKNMIDRINFRFHRLNGKSENRVWNIQLFESITIFNINSALQNMKSFETVNNGVDVSAEDHTLQDSTPGKILRYIRQSFPSLDKVRFINTLGRFILQISNYHRDVKLRKWF